MAIWQTARLNVEEAGGLGWLGRASDAAPRPAAGAPAGMFVGLQPPPVALRGRRSVASALANLEDFTLTLGRRAARTLADPGPGEDLAAFVRGSTLDAYAAADQMEQVLRGADAGARYPATALAGKLRLVARLLKTGYGTRVFYTTQAGYDTHAGQLQAHGPLLAEFSGAVRAFLDDLAAARLADRVAVLAFSEFGRRVAENGSGTDHGTAGPVFLVGSRVKAGLVGRTPSLLDLQDGDLKVGLDFRQVYATVLEDWLGIPARSALAGGFERLPLFRG
jgi:uncharacterized protein (DUF1501 family)